MNETYEEKQRRQIQLMIDTGSEPRGKWLRLMAEMDDVDWNGGREECCADCYWHHITDCRKRAPRVHIFEDYPEQTFWPPVELNEWCGDFKPLK